MGQIITIIVGILAAALLVGVLIVVLSLLVTSLIVAKVEILIGLTVSVAILAIFGNEYQSIVFGS